MSADLDKGDAFFEGNPFVGEILLSHPSLANVGRLSVFMSPLPGDEIGYLRSQSSLPSRVPSRT